MNKLIEQLDKSGSNLKTLAIQSRFQKLSSIQIDELNKRYCILISVGKYDGSSLITEHNKYKAFKNTTKRYINHPANPEIPIQAHYHIYPHNGKNEIYAVNMDGTAHHKGNRGYEILKKEAVELKKMGVQIPANRIIENDRTSL